MASSSSVALHIHNHLLMTGQKSLSINFLDPHSSYVCVCPCPFHSPAAAVSNKTIAKSFISNTHTQIQKTSPKFKLRRSLLDLSSSDARSVFRGRRNKKDSIRNPLNFTPIGSYATGLSLSPFVVFASTNS